MSLVCLPGIWLGKKNERSERESENESKKVERNQSAAVGCLTKRTTENKAAPKLNTYTVPMERIRNARTYKYGKRNNLFLSSLSHSLVWRSLYTNVN